VVLGGFFADPFVVDVELDVAVIINARRLPFEKKFTGKGIKDLVCDEKGVVDVQFIQPFDMRESDRIAE